MFNHKSEPKVKDTERDKLIKQLSHKCWVTKDHLENYTRQVYILNLTVNFYSGYLQDLENNDLKIAKKKLETALHNYEMAVNGYLAELGNPSDRVTTLEYECSFNPEGRVVVNRIVRNILGGN